MEEEEVQVVEVLLLVYFGGIHRCSPVSFSP